MSIAVGLLTAYPGPALPLCSDGIDNDLDGLIDDEDPGCTDSDGDSVSDPTEELLGSDPNAFDSLPEHARFDTLLESFGLPVFFCADFTDNDGDGLTDPEDPGREPIDDHADGVDDAAENLVAMDGRVTTEGKDRHGAHAQRSVRTPGTRLGESGEEGGEEGGTSRSEEGES